MKQRFFPHQKQPRNNWGKKCYKRANKERGWWKNETSLWHKSQHPAQQLAVVMMEGLWEGFEITERFQIIGIIGMTEIVTHEFLMAWEVVTFPATPPCKFILQTPNLQVRLLPEMRMRRKPGLSLIPGYRIWTAFMSCPLPVTSGWTEFMLRMTSDPDLDPLVNSCSGQPVYLCVHDFKKNTCP